MGNCDEVCLFFSFEQASQFRELSTPEVLSKISALKQEIASVRFLQRTRGISEVKPGEQQNPDPEKVNFA